MKPKMILFIFVFISHLFVAQIPTGYYNSATAAGYALKTQLKTIIDDINDANGLPYHDTSVTYGDLWELYKTSDVRIDGNVWDIYSDCNFVFSTDQDSGTGGTTECDKYNREHTFAQSWYGGSNSHPLRADAFHVLPSDKKVNNIRGNYAFGEVLTADYTSANGSKRGTSKIIGPNDLVFEPINAYKGDIARGLFYVAVRYQNEIASWENNNNGGDNMLDGTNNKVFEQWALDMLFRWHTEDPVSQKEMDRNEAIFTHQKNRNPFIDHPNYVAEIWGDVLSSPEMESISFKIYPNPITNNMLYIETNQPVTLFMYNILGKIIRTQKISASKEKINVSDLHKGIYFIKIKSESESSTRKFMII